MSACFCRVRASSPTVDELCRPMPPACLLRKCTERLSPQHLAANSTRLSPRRSADQQQSMATITRSSLPAVSEYTTSPTITTRRRSSLVPSTVVARRRRSRKDLLLVAATSMDPMASTRGRRSLDHIVKHVSSDEASPKVVKIASFRRSTRRSLDELRPVATIRSSPRRSTDTAGHPSTRESGSSRKWTSLAQSIDDPTRRLSAVEAPSTATTSEVPMDVVCSQELPAKMVSNDYEPVQSTRKASRRLKTTSAGTPPTNGLCSTEQSAATTVCTATVEYPGVSPATTSKQAALSTVATSKRLAARPASTQSRRSSPMSSSIVVKKAESVSECLSAPTQSKRSTSTSPSIVAKKAKTVNKRGSLSSDTADENQEKNPTTPSLPR